MWNMLLSLPIRPKFHDLKQTSIAPAMVAHGSELRHRARDYAAFVHASRLRRKRGRLDPNRIYDLAR
jgi:hypothetical protein